MQSNLDEFVVSLFFDEEGDLVDVTPAPGKEEEGYKKDPLPTLRGQNCYWATTLIYGHGSPGYTIYKTKNSYIKIIKPQ